MATPEFFYQDPFPLSKDDTPYRLLTKEHVSLTKFDGKDILKIEPEALTLLANEAIRDVSFLLRTPHLKKVAAILKDPEASENDRYVRSFTSFRTDVEPGTHSASSGQALNLEQGAGSACWGDSLH